jgi:hypothetical protein
LQDLTRLHVTTLTAVSSLHGVFSGGWRNSGVGLEEAAASDHTEGSQQVWLAAARQQPRSVWQVAVALGAAVLLASSDQQQSGSCTLDSSWQHWRMCLIVDDKHANSSTRWTMVLCLKVLCLRMH